MEWRHHRNSVLRDQRWLGGVTFKGAGLQYRREADQPGAEMSDSEDVKETVTVIMNFGEEEAESEVTVRGPTRPIFVSTTPTYCH